jgi:ABC-2 type transport system ATP-binding protein
MTTDKKHESTAALSLEVSGISKRFSRATVVDDVSFDVVPGEIFGLIGPNGAGKTTTIRMIMDIIQPDSGTIKVLGNRLGEQTKNRIGYLPEERGLYKKLTIMQSIEYIASLKGVPRQPALERAHQLLQRVDMLPHQNKKTEELSRGMSQIVQFMITIVHEPELIILDEPFANLDPVNTELLKDIILELKAEGKSIILSTHRMNEIEELCDRVFMISKGRGVLYGELAEIKSRYRRNSVFLEYEGELGEIPGVTRHNDRQGSTELVMSEEITPQQVLEKLMKMGIIIDKYEVSTPPLNDIFLEVVGKADE